MINIIAGSNKKTNLEVPKGIDVRPTSALKREAIFSIIESYSKKYSFEIYSKNCFIDFYAGSGSFGLEGISRGASYVYFYENNTNVLKCLEKNCQKICIKNNFTIFKEDIDKIKINNIRFPVSVIFIDPPYILNPFEKLLKKIISENILNKNTLIVIEISKKSEVCFPKDLLIFDERIYGKTKILFLKKL
jgi:N6-adenine-specific methylase|tara:strand:- start:138 stop:707 length:570 start_codon:yes stop_codon:yes gene_type:complete